MQDNYVDMHDNYVDMQDDYAGMQVTNPFKEIDSLKGLLK